MLLGAVILAWQGFAGTWQPLPAGLPDRTLCAWIAGGVFLAAGVALVVRRLEVAAALAVAALSLVFAAGWIARIAGAPYTFGTWLGLAEQMAVVLGGLAVVAALQSRPGTMAQGLRVLFGICLLAFGTAHFLYLGETAGMVPGWLPAARRFWALATGAANLAAGIALVAGPLARVAAYLASAMFLGFGLFVWLPRVLAAPTDQTAWAGTAITLAIAAGAWAMADLIARAPPPALGRR